MLMMRYSTVYSIKKEFDWNLNHDVSLYGNVQQKKESRKHPLRLLINTCQTKESLLQLMTISKAVMVRTSEDIKNYIVRKYIKETLGWATEDKPVNPVV